jgi:hypothetical protein
MGAQVVQQPDRVLGVRHTDVNVEREGRLAPSNAAHGPVHELVTAGPRDPGVLSHLRRVHARDRGREPEVARIAGKPRPEAAQLCDRGADRGMRARVQLERRLVCLRRAVLGEVVADQSQHRVGALRQRPGVGIEEHHLLLEAHAVRGRRLPIRPAGCPFETAVLGRDGRLVHGCGSCGQRGRCWPP